MKKALIIFAIFLAVSVAVVVIFLMTFNADHYRPAVIQMIQKQTGKTASLDKIYLGFKNGITLNVSGITLYNREGDSEPSMRVGQIMANVRLMPLLKKQIQVTEILIKEPSIEILKSAAGKISAGGFEQNNSNSQAAKIGNSSQAITTSMPSLAIESIRVQDGRIHYRDLSAKSGTDLTVDKLDVDVTNFSLNKPFEILAKASLYSKEQNIYANALVTLPSSSSAGQVESLVIQIDLSKSLPPSPALKKIKGNLQVTSQKIIFGQKNSRFDVLLKDASLSMDGLPEALTQVHMQAIYEKDKLTVSSLNAMFADAPISARAVVSNISSSQNLNFQVSLRDLDIQRLAKRSNPNAPRLSGKLSMDIEGVAQGLIWPAISRSLNARGQLNLREGVLLNYNVVREVMQKLSAIPGAQEALSSRLPQAYSAAMNENSTLLKPVLMPFVVQDGAMIVNPVNVDSDFVSIYGALSYRLDNFLSLEGLLRLSGELSAALADAAPMISPILNTQGLIEIPFTAQGALPHIKVVPDVKGVTSKIVSAKAGEALSEYLKDPAGAKKNIRGILQRVTGTE